MYVSTLRCFLKLFWEILILFFVVVISRDCGKSEENSGNFSSKPKISRCPEKLVAPAARDGTSPKFPQNGSLDLNVPIRRPLVTNFENLHESRWDGIILRAKISSESSIYFRIGITLSVAFVSLIVSFKKCMKSLSRMPHHNSGP